MYQDPSPQRPFYSVAIVPPDGTTYQVKGLDYGVVTELKLSEPKGSITQTASMTMVNISYGGKYLTDIFNVMDRVFVFANDGLKQGEVFRGIVWGKNYVSKDEKLLTLLCYDNLIYFQNSEDSLFYPSGKSTENICNDICWRWGVKLEYNYRSITHKKLPLKGTLSDIFTTDVLGEVKKQTGVRAVMRSIEDVVHIDEVGGNQVIYRIVSGKNAISAGSKETMDGVVTQVIITGKADDNDRLPIRETMDGSTTKYGTLRKVKAAPDEKKLDEIRNEARELLNENGKPKKTLPYSAVDIPWVRKGDTVSVQAGEIISGCYVLSVEHNAETKQMELELEQIQAAESEEAGGASAASGGALNLSNAPIYISSDARRSATHVSGTYYLYDGKEIAGRYRITNNKGNVGRRPVDKYVTGWLDKSHVK